MESTISAPQGGIQEEPRVVVQVEQPVVKTIESTANPVGGTTPPIVTVSSDEEPHDTAELGDQVTSVVAVGSATPLEKEEAPEERETTSGVDQPVEQCSPHTTEPPRRPRLKSMVVQGCSGDEGAEETTLEAEIEHICNIPK